jgi:probable F420-dependent oxidoreductase
MRFGLSLPHYGFSLPGGEPITFAEMASWARRAEAIGFDSVWVSDHFFYSFARYGADPAPISALEPVTALAGVAAVTERVRLGTLVLCSPFRHPAMVAKMANTLDAISGGRLDLGVGAGWLEDEFTAFGYPFGEVGERFAILQETLEVLEALGSGEPVTFDGPTVSLRGARALPRAVQKPGVPVWVGGKGGPRLLGLAARHAVGWNAVWRWSPEAYGERAAVAARACEGVGRDPASFRLSVGLYGLMGEDEAAARAAFERGRAAMPGGAMDHELYEDWRADTLSGTPEQVIDRVRAFEAIGVEEIVLSPWVLPFAIHEPAQVDLFVERVMMPLRVGT